MPTPEKPSNSDTRTKVVLYQEYTPFSEWNKSGDQLASWDFAFMGILGSVRARFDKPVLVEGEDPPLASPLGITNSSQWEPKEGCEDIGFSIETRVSSIPDFDIAREIVTLFDIGGQKYWCGLEGDNLIDDDNFDDTEHLYDALAAHKTRSLHNWSMHQGPGGDFQVRIPLKTNPQAIKIAFMPKIHALLLMELSHESVGARDSEQMSFGLVDIFGNLLTCKQS